MLSKVLCYPSLLPSLNTDFIVMIIIILVVIIIVILIVIRIVIIIIFVIAPIIIIIIIVINYILLLQLRVILSAEFRGGAKGSNVLSPPSTRIPPKKINICISLP